MKKLVIALSALSLFAFAPVVYSQAKQEVKKEQTKKQVKKSKKQLLKEKAAK